MVAARLSIASVSGKMTLTHAVGRARMEMHMVIERRSEAVQKGDGAESRASYARPVAGTGRARRSAQQSLDLSKRDLRAGC